MNTVLSTANNMLLPNVAAYSVSSLPAESSKTKQFSVPNYENKGIKTDETFTTDNTPTKNSDVNIKQLRDDSDPSLDEMANQEHRLVKSDEKTAPEQSKINQDTTKSNNNHITAETNQTTNESQPATAPVTEGIATDSTGKDIAKNNINTSQEQTALQNILKTSIFVKTKENTQLTSSSDQNGKAANINSIQTATTKSQAENKIITSTTGQNQIKPNIILSNSQTAEVINKGETELSSKISSVIKEPVNQGNNTEATAKILNTDSQKANSGEKQLSASSSITSSAQKTSILNQSIPTADNKQNNNQQNVLVAATKISPKTDESANDKTLDGQTSLDVNSGNNKIHANTTAESISKDLNIEQIGITTNQSKDNNNPSSNNNSNQVFKELISSNNLQSSPEEPAAPSASNKAANTALPSDVSTSVSKQIQESIHSSLRDSQQQITIRLNPPELGKVSIKIQEQSGQITGLMEVSNTQTRFEIQRMLPEIIQNLQDSGIQIKQINVIPTNQQEQQAFKDQSLAEQHNGETGQQNLPNSNQEGNHSAWTEPNDWQRGIESYGGASQPYAQITNDFIDVLV